MIKVSTVTTLKGVFQMVDSKEKKLILDTSHYEESVSDGVKVVAFWAKTGEKVCFKRCSSTDQIVRVDRQSLEGKSWSEARLICLAKNLLPSRVISKGWKSTTKKVESPAPAASPEEKKPAPVKKPSWLNKKLAIKHAGQIDPHKID